MLKFSNLTLLWSQRYQFPVVFILHRCLQRSSKTPPFFLKLIYLPLILKKFNNDLQVFLFPLHIWYKNSISSVYADGKGIEPYLLCNDAAKFILLYFLHRCTIWNSNLVGILLKRLAINFFFLYATVLEALAEISRKCIYNAYTITRWIRESSYCFT